MLILSKEESEQVKRALQLSVIYMEEHPYDDSPIRKVLEGLRIVVHGTQDGNRCQKLEDMLHEVLREIADESGTVLAVLRPSPALVEKVKKVLGNGW